MKYTDTDVRELHLVASRIACKLQDFCRRNPYHEFSGGNLGADALIGQWHALNTRVNFTETDDDRHTISLRDL